MWVMTDLVKIQMWWLIGSAADFWDRGPGFESGFPYYDPDALPDHCVIMQQNLMGSEGKPMPKEKDFFMPGSGQWMWIRRKDVDPAGSVSAILQN